MVVAPAARAPYKSRAGHVPAEVALQQKNVARRHAREQAFDIGGCEAPGGLVRADDAVLAGAGELDDRFVGRARHGYQPVGAEPFGFEARPDASAAGSCPRPAQNLTSAPARCAMIAWFSPLPPTSTVRSRASTVCPAWAGARPVTDVENRVADDHDCQANSSRRSVRGRESHRSARSSSPALLGGADDWS